MTPDDARRLLDDVEAFCRELRPIEDRCYAERRHNDELVPLARRYGLLAIPVSVEYGGRGADAATYCRALARIGREGTAVRTFFSGHTSIGAYPILTWGSEEQKRRYLPAAARGERVLAFGLTEPDAGSNPLELTTTYARDGQDFRLDGVKYLISNGGACDTLVAFAYPAGGGRMSAFLVDRGDGFISEEITAKLGMPTVTTARIELRGCRVPAGNLLGAEGDGFRVAMGTLVSGRLSVAAGCLGVIEDCLAECLDYARRRRQHGKPIGKHQLVQGHLAAIEQARLASDCVLTRAAAAKDAGEPGADLLAAQAKLFASAAAWDAADRAVQVFGGRGWLTENRVARHLADVRVCRLYEGTDEVLTLKVAAALLGKEFEAYR